MTTVRNDRRRLLFSALCVWGGFAAQIVVAFFLTPLFVTGLGRERFGVWSLVESILAYLTLFDLGVAAALVRHTAALNESGDIDRLNRVFSTSAAIFAAAGAVVVAVCGGLMWSVGSSILAVPDDLLGDTRVMLLVLGINLGLQLPAGIYPALLDGLGKFPTKSLVRTASLFIRSGLLLWVLDAGYGLPGIAATVTLCTVAENFVFVVLAHRYLPGLRLRRRFISREALRTIRGYSVYALVILIAARISFQTDAFVIQSRLAVEWITPFALAALLVQRGKDALHAATTVLMPHVSALAERDDHGAIREMLIRGTRYVLWIAAPLQAGLIVLGGPFLALWMWREPDVAAEAHPVLIVLAAPFALAMAQGVAGRVLYGTGRLRWLAIFASVEAALNLLLSLLLVDRYGIVGVAWGTAIPNLAFCVVVLVHVCRDRQLAVWEYFRRAALGPLLLAVIPAATWWAAARWGAIENWRSFVAVGAVGLAAYAPFVALAELGVARRFAARSLWRPAASRVESC